MGAPPPEQHVAAPTGRYALGDVDDLDGRKPRSNALHRRRDLAEHQYVGRLRSRFWRHDSPCRVPYGQGSDTLRRLHPGLPFDRFRSGRLIIRIRLPNASVRQEIFIATSLRPRSAFWPPSEGRPESPGTVCPNRPLQTSGCLAPYPGAPEHSSGGKGCHRTPVSRRTNSVVADRLLAITPVGFATPVVD
jgi:hypothetical protein